MKKGDIVTGTIVEMEFPNKGILQSEEGDRIVVKNAIPLSCVTARINKRRHGKAEGALLEVVKNSPKEVSPLCEHFNSCGGCVFQSLLYEDECELKDHQMHLLFDPIVKDSDCVFEPLVKSPVYTAYRNKMEFTFGDEYKDGPLSLGMHKRGSFYDIVRVDSCKIVDADVTKILSATIDYFTEKKVPHYHRMRHDGFLRHLLIRRSEYTKEILVGFVSTSNTEYNDRDLIGGYVDALLSLELKGRIAGIIHIINDNVADAIKVDEQRLLYGVDYIEDRILGLSFKITPFSFFQTNTLGAEVLYSKIREFVKSLDIENGSIYDLYSGTGTITQIMGQIFENAVGVEIVEEAVEAAKENAVKNGLKNCRFIAGDVLKVLDELTNKPDLIILDPPRDGVHPKALPKLLSYGCKYYIYVACKPTSLLRDIPVFMENGYKVKRLCPVDQFPRTANCEMIALLERV